MSGLFGVFLFLAAVALVGGLLGAGLLIAPGPLLAFYRRSVLATLDTPVRIERFVYRNHRLFGAAIALSALFSSIMLGSLLGGQVPAGWETGSTILLAGNLAALVLGLIMFVRPSLLKGLEQRANRWVPSIKGMQRGPGEPLPLSQLHLLGATLLALSLLLLGLLSRYMS